MSGFEAIGIVLGALPLIISAFEHGQSLAKKWGLLNNFNVENLKVWNDIRDEEIMYRSQLRTLLAPLVWNGDLTKDCLETLMVNPQSDAWREPDLEVALRKRLGEGYDRYFGNIEEIQALAWRLLEPLARSSVFKAQMSTKNSSPKDQMMLKSYTRLKDKYRHGCEKLKFATSKDQRDEILSEIHAKIEKLERFLAASDQFAAFEESSKLAISRQSVKNLMGYWKHADRIFALLLSTWVCPCRQTHCAHLWLQHRTSAHFEFRMLVMFAPTSSGSSLVAPWQQHGLKIEWASLKDPVAKQIVDAALMPPPQRLIIPSAIAGQHLRPGILSRHGKAKKLAKATISFDDTAVTSGLIPFVRHVAGTASMVSEPSLKKNKPSTDSAASQSRSISSEVINDLCRTMESCGMRSECLGLLVDANQGNQYQVSSQPEQKVVAGEVTLRELLHPDRRPRVSRAQRFQIALKIASSHLQLHSTSWARRQWESGDVRFPQIGANATDVLLDRPFVSANFEPELPSALRVPKATDRSFACLGIMMLELLFGVQLEEHDLWLKFGAKSTDDPTFRSMVAKTWAEDVKDEAGPEFSSAVKWCLHESPATLHDDRWRKDLACEVVLPLQNCCGWIDPASVVDE